MLKNLLGSRTTPAAQLAPHDAPTPAPRASVIDFTKSAEHSLRKAGLGEEKAAVYLVLDRSRSMRDHYRDGSVQTLGEQALGLARNLDDDGTVPVVFFSTAVDGLTEITLDNFSGHIDTKHQQLGHMGTTNYQCAIDQVVAHYQASGATTPAVIIFQTDGGPDSIPATNAALIAAKKLPMYWYFVGYGQRVDFLRSVGRLEGINNTGFFHAPNPHAVQSEDLYQGLTAGYGRWLAAARAVGIAH